MTVTVIAKLTANDGQRDELVAALQPMLEHVEANEPDTLAYVLMEDVKDPNLLWLYEKYPDQAALNAHSSSHAMKELATAVRPYAASRPEVVICNPIGGKGL